MAIYCAQKANIPTVYIEHRALTPDTTSADIVCPDVFKVMSWAIQTEKHLYKGAAIPPSHK